MALWTPGEFERQMESMQEQAGQGRAERNRARVWASSSAEVEIDRQGRMPIPAHLRTFAGLESEVLVLGVIDRVELWNPAAWAEKVQPEESWLLGDDEERDHDRAANTDRRHPTQQETASSRARWTMCSSSTGIAWRTLRPLPGRSFGSPLPLDLPAGGLQMAHSFSTFPCCATKWSRSLPRCQPEPVVDATVGGGGHADGAAGGLPGAARARSRSRHRGAGRRGAAGSVRRPGHA